MAMEEEQELFAHDRDEDEEKGGKPKLELTVDEIIEEYVGSFGFSQLVHVFLVSLAWIFDSQHTLVTIFTDAEPQWRCKMNGYECWENASLCDLHPKAWEWVGGERMSTVAEWGLICGHRFRAGIPTCSAIQGRLADSSLGRRKTLFYSCLFTSITAFLTSLSPNIWVYSILRFCNGFARSGIGICCLVLSTESVGRRWRGQVGQYGFFFFTAGFLSLPIISYPLQNSWRNIYRSISLLPLLYCLFIFPSISESPRWLSLRERKEEAMQVLTKLAQSNGKKIPKNLTISNPSCTQPGSRTCNLWSSKWARKRMALVMAVGLGVGFVYYGVQLNAQNLYFNLYFTVALNALMEIPAVFLGSVLLSCMDRRVLFSLSAIIAGISCFLCVILSRDRQKNKDQAGNWSQLSVESIGFMCISTAFDVMYIYCVELFPTSVRNFAVSMLRQALMFGASMAPMLVAQGRLSPFVSYLVFGGVGIFSGIFGSWLPETRNRPLYETLEQQEHEEMINEPYDSEMVKLPS
ncbi:hypothetical protein AMTR_s00029p00167630 [Amborella trichopoda]|uniref:Major facilitator superfamily (MFS) profile domain-containing protein n=1 Tax=Amborella trichopoda TaxID=13333 RepID=W1PPD3_AMBTC|nr:hypothetical protein AMTR_s00029p00167630 [Amborella trichopoda]